MMSSEKLLNEERILELEKKLLESINNLNECKKENDEFIYIASHDLQAPLRKLSTLVELLCKKLSENSSEEIKSYVDRIKATAESMRSLINSLSALSDVNNDVSFLKCNLNDVMSDTIKELSPLIKKNNTKISFSSLPQIDADASQLKEVFKNLLDNSIKFQNKNATPEIIINSELVNNEEKIIFKLPESKVYYKIEFADNGIGFKKEYSDKIFKPFQRLHGKATYAGNGLGLAICKKIIENHQGIIYANENENSGSRFVLILPQSHN